ncbi:antitoxin VapB family protein [Candidatus Woesearchaeota archaeon]|nr:antitoxin VapB family protein [Candidatus Woesearchaeota archaeon]
MSSKTISITKQVYEDLAKAKSPRESFSEEITKLLRRKGRLNECAGLWSWMSEIEATGIKKAIGQCKERSRQQWKKRIGAIA